MKSLQKDYEYAFAPFVVLDAAVDRTMTVDIEKETEVVLACKFYVLDIRTASCCSTHYSIALKAGNLPALE